MHCLKWLTLGVLFFAHSPAFAYIPPVSFILSEALKNHADFKTIVMEGRIVDLRSQSALKENLKIDFVSGKFSATYLNDSTNEAEGVVEGHLNDLPALGRFWLTLAMDPNHSRFHEAVAALGITGEEKSDAKLKRISGHVTFSWGLNPSVAFLKDEFLPISYQTAEGDALISGIVLADYTSSSSDTRVPKTVLVKVQGKDAFRYEAKIVHLNQTLKVVDKSALLKSNLAKDWAALVR